MAKDGEVLLDEALVPERAAGPRAGVMRRSAFGIAAPTTVEVTDEDVEGSRILIVRSGKRQSKAAKKRKGGACELSCTFQPADGTRFVSGRVLVRIDSPSSARFIDVAPTEITKPVKVEMTYTADGHISLGYKKIAKGEASKGQTKALSYGSYICLVTGSGAGSREARWDFSEDPNMKSGIGFNQILAMTVPSKSEVTATLTVRAALAKSGLFGRTRDLVLGQKKRTTKATVTLFKP